MRRIILTTALALMALNIHANELRDIEDKLDEISDQLDALLPERKVVVPKGYEIVPIKDGAMKGLPMLQRILRRAEPGDAEPNRSRCAYRRHWTLGAFSADELQFIVQTLWAWVLGNRCSSAHHQLIAEFAAELDARIREGDL